MAKGGVSFKDSVSMYGRIVSDIEGGRFAPVYLLMGEEGYFIDRVADMLAERVLGEAERAFNQVVVYGKDCDAGAVINYARQMPMMGGWQVVIVREAQGMRGVEQLHLYTQAPSPTTILVICHKERAIDKRSPLYKHVRERGVVLESVRPRDYEIGGWLGDFVRERGLKIEPRAQGMLADHLGVDIARISNELDKLLTFLPEGTKMITADHVESNIGISKEFNNFELTRALSERDMGRALMIAERLGHDANPAWYGVTLGVVFTHFQRIFMLNYQRWLAQKKGVPMPADVELARMLKLNHAFFLGEYKTAAAGYPNRKVFSVLGMIREYDLRGKGVGGGSVGRGDMLRELLLKIFMV